MCMPLEPHFWWLSKRGRLAGASFWKFRWTAAYAGRLTRGSVTFPVPWSRSLSAYDGNSLSLRQINVFRTEEGEKGCFDKRTIALRAAAACAVDDALESPSRRSLAHRYRLGRYG